MFSRDHRQEKSELAPRDVGFITPEHRTRFVDVADLLARLHQLTDTYIAIDGKLDKLLPTFEPELIHVIRQDMSEIGERVKQLQKITSPNSADEEQAYHDLNLLAALKQETQNPFFDERLTEDEKDELFFSEQDRLNAFAARSDTPTSHWLPKRVGLKTDVKELVGRAGLHQAFKAKVAEQRQLAAHHEERELARLKLAERLKQNINVAELSRAETRLHDLSVAVELLEAGGDVLKDAQATALQKIRAKRAMDVAKEYLLSPKEERNINAITTAEADLRRALDLPRLTKQAHLKVERMITDMLEQMATARVQMKGLQHVFETLPMARRPDTDALHAAKAKLAEAGEHVEMSFREAQATTKHVLNTLDQGLADPELVEGLVSTIHNGNLRELYLSSFDEAMAQLKKAIVEFSQLLKLAPSKELQARPLPKEPALPPHEREGVVSIERAIEFLGRENVHGVEDVEAMLGQGFVDRSKVPPIPYSEDDLAKSQELKTKGVEEMLVLFIMDQDGTPLTGEKLNALIQKKYDELGFGKFLFNTDWYKNKDFYKTLGLTYEWKLLTKRCIPDSKDKRHDWKKGDSWKSEETQEYVINQLATDNRIPRDHLHRTQPFHLLYAQALHFVTTERIKGRGKGERLLTNEYHWSDVRSSVGVFVCVGGADAVGAGMRRSSRELARGYFGVCLSRDPS